MRPVICNGNRPYCTFTTSSATNTAWVVAGPETFVSLVHHCNYSVEKYLERLGHTLRSALIEPAISAAQRSAAQRSAAQRSAK